VGSCVHRLIVALHITCITNFLLVLVLATDQERVWDIIYIHHIFIYTKQYKL